MAKKELAIVFGVTGNISFTVGNMLLGLKKYVKDRTFDCIVYHLGVSAEDQNVLNSILPCRFIQYDFPVLDPDKYEFLAGKRYTVLAYARYECFVLLEEYKTVLWLDTDILLVRNVSELFTINRTGIALFLQKGSVLGSRFKSVVEGYDVSCEFYNTGVILLHDNLQDRTQLKDWCYKKTYELAEVLACADMGIINLMVQEFNLEVDKLPEKFNAHPRHWLYEKGASIIHAYGGKKFWNYYWVPEWERNYRTWHSMGGTKYDGARKNVLHRIFNTVSLIVPPRLRRPKYVILDCLNHLKKNMTA